MKDRLAVFLLFLVVTLLGCNKPQVIGKWKREFGPELEKEFGPEINGFGNLTLNADSTYLIAGDGHKDTAGDSIPGWHVGHDQRGKWRLEKDKLFLKLENLEPGIYLGYDIIELTRKKLVLLSPFDKGDTTKYIVYSRIINFSHQKSPAMRDEGDKKDVVSFFQDLYKNFNDRKIDLVISEMTDDVKWANGMEGGFVYGREGVREYWTRQFKMVSSKVVPVKIEKEKDFIKIKVHQVVHDMQSNLLADEYVYHLFKLKEGRIAEFHIGEKTKN